MQELLSILFTSVPRMVLSTHGDLKKYLMNEQTNEWVIEWMNEWSGVGKTEVGIVWRWRAFCTAQGARAPSRETWGSESISSQQETWLFPLGGSRTSPSLWIDQESLGTLCQRLVRGERGRAASTASAALRCWVTRWVGGRAQQHRSPELEMRPQAQASRPSDKCYPDFSERV